MKRQPACWLVFALTVIFLVGCSGGGKAPEAKIKYPEKAITIAVHGTPGSGPDVFGRQVSKVLEGILKQPVVVENKSGGSGAVATTYVGKAPPDGYTLLGVTNTLNITPFVATTPNSLADLEPVARVSVDPCVVYVRNDCPYKTAEELLNAAKEKQQKWSCPGASSPDHVAVAGLRDKEGLKIDPIPYQGGAEGLAAVLKGDVVAGTGEPGELAGQLKAGAIRILALFTPNRVASLPGIPTLKELGYDVSFEKYRGFMVPKGTPSEVKSILVDAFKKVTEDQGFRTFIEQNSSVISFLGPEEFGKQLEEERKVYAQFFGKK